MKNALILIGVACCLFGGFTWVEFVRSLYSGRVAAESSIKPGTPCRVENVRLEQPGTRRLDLELNIVCPKYTSDMQRNYRGWYRYPISFSFKDPRGHSWLSGEAVYTSDSDNTCKESIFGSREGSSGKPLKIGGTLLLARFSTDSAVTGSIEFRLDPDSRYGSTVESARVLLKEGVKEVPLLQVLAGTGLLVLGIGGIGFALLKL